MTKNKAREYRIYAFYSIRYSGMVYEEKDVLMLSFKQPHPPNMLLSIKEKYVLMKDRKRQCNSKHLDPF